MAGRPRKGEKPKLTPKQKKFCHEFLLDRNYGASAIRAGYSVRSAPDVAHYTANQPHVKEYLDKLLREQDDRVIIKADEVLTEYRRIALSDPLAMFDESGCLRPLKEIPLELRRCISSIDVKELWEKDAGGERVQIGVVKSIKLWNKNQALDAVGKHLKLFNGADDAHGDNKNITVNFHFKGSGGERQVQPSSSDRSGTRDD
jgi:phage terminase small subunit